MTEPSNETWARAYVAGLLERGQAEELMEAWSLWGQTWPYVAGIIDHVAQEGSSMTAQEFARSLQEESWK